MLLAPLLLALPLPGDLLFAEHFPDAQALSAWTVIDGATLGADPPSEAGWDDGALQLQATSGTRRFLALTRRVPVAGPAVRVSVRLRTAGVERDGAHFVNCNAFVRGQDLPLLPLPQLFGDNDWTGTARCIALPEGCTEIEIGLFLSLPGRAWFDDVTVEAVPWPWTEVVRGTYVFVSGPGDAPSEEDMATCANLRAGIADWLGVKDERVVRFVRYHDRTAKLEWTGNAGNAHVEGDTIHTLWPVDNHEIVHILARDWGHPPALLAEGLAVHLSESWQGKPVREYAADVALNGRALKPSELLDTACFRAADDSDAYALAGAFVEWVETTRGKDTLRALYGALSNDAAADVNLRVLGDQLREQPARVDAEFLKWLGETRR